MTTDCEHLQRNVIVGDFTLDNYLDGRADFICSSCRQEFIAAPTSTEQALIHLEYNTVQLSIGCGGVPFTEEELRLLREADISEEEIDEATEHFREEDEEGHLLD